MALNLRIKPLFQGLGQAGLIGPHRYRSTLMSIGAFLHASPHGSMPLRFLSRRTMRSRSIPAVEATRG